MTRTITNEKIKELAATTPMSYQDIGNLAGISRERVRQIVSGENKSNKYKRIMRDGVRMPYHRWLMEQELGRKLLPTEFVRHLNGDIQDNRLDNLELVTSYDRHPAPASV